MEKEGALALGGQWVSRQTDDEFALAARDAPSKIGAVHPSELQHKVDDNAFHVGRLPKRHSLVVQGAIFANILIACEPKADLAVRVANGDPVRVEVNGENGVTHRLCHCEQHGV